LTYTYFTLLTLYQNTKGVTHLKKFLENFHTRFT